MLTIEPASPDEPDMLALIAASDANSASLYPAESRHALNVEALKAEARFFAARLEGRTVGCAGFTKSPEGYAELRRMFVDKAGRGRGVGRALLERIEAEAFREGIRLMRLETGVKSLEALRLYRSSGYAERGPFGKYGPDPLCVFMEKPLKR